MRFCCFLFTNKIVLKQWSHDQPRPVHDHSTTSPPQPPHPPTTSHDHSTTIPRPAPLTPTTSHDQSTTIPRPYLECECLRGIFLFLFIFFRSELFFRSFVFQSFFFFLSFLLCSSGVDVSCKTLFLRCMCCLTFSRYTAHTALPTTMRANTKCASSLGLRS